MESLHEKKNLTFGNKTDRHDPPWELPGDDPTGFGTGE
jgi:hypothetical protein